MRATAGRNAGARSRVASRRRASRSRSTPSVSVARRHGGTVNRARPCRRRARWRQRERPRRKAGSDGNRQSRLLCRSRKNRSPMTRSARTSQRKVRHVPSQSHRRLSPPPPLPRAWRIAAGTRIRRQCRMERFHRRTGIRRQRRRPGIPGRLPATGVRNYGHGLRSCRAPLLPSVLPGPGRYRPGGLSGAGRLSRLRSSIPLRSSIRRPVVYRAPRVPAAARRGRGARVAAPRVAVPYGVY